MPAKFLSNLLSLSTCITCNKIITVSTQTRIIQSIGVMAKSFIGGEVTGEEHDYAVEEAQKYKEYMRAEQRTMYLNTHRFGDDLESALWLILWLAASYKEQCAS